MERSEGRTDPAYWNIAGPFGGWIASQLLGRVLDDPRRRGDPISTSTSFVGPIEEGAFSIDVRLLRANRSTDFWWAELRQERGGVEQVCAYATVSCALRPSTLAHLEQTMPDAPPPQEVTERRIPLPLKWIAHYELRMATAGPFTGKGSARSLTWARKRDVPLDFAALTEICDTAIPRLFYRTRGPIPIATVTMNVFFHVGANELREVGTDFILCDANWHGANDGYFDEQQVIWSRSGQLLATTDQLVWYRLPSDEDNGETRR
jgi:acyl-CoA thioesterase